MKKIVYLPLDERPADCYLPWSRLFEIGLKIEER